MMISSPSAGDRYAAAAALDRALRSSSGDDGGGDADASSSDSRTLDSSPDVVVTLSQGMASPSTYNAAGKMSSAPASADDSNADAHVDEDAAVPA